MTSETDKWGWGHVSVFGGFHRGSGSKRWKCNHCNLRYNGSYSRVRAHLLGFSGVGVKSCPAIDQSLREAFQILEEQRSAQRKKNSRNERPGKRRCASLPHLSCKTIRKEDVDEIVARFFYANELNIDSVSSPYFHEVLKAVGTFGSGYEPPSRDKLSNFLLCREKTRIDKSVTLIKESWPHTGCTIMCTASSGSALGSFRINIFVSSPRGLVFLKAVEVDDGDKGEHAFTDALHDAIVEVGSRNVLQIVANLRGFGKSTQTYILSKFPNIFWSSCTSYSISLLMEEISELEWAKPIFLCAKAIEQCMMTYQPTSCAFSQYLEDSSEPISSKFSPSYSIIQRILELKRALQDVVVSKEWKLWKHSIAEDVASVEAAILGDDFWGKAHLLLQLYEPFVRLLVQLDIDRSVIGTIHDWRVQAFEALRSKAIDDGLLNQLHGLIENRWDVLFSPLHAAGYILNPKYIGKGQAKDKSVMRGWKATLERYECETASRRALREQLSLYWHLEGSFGDEDAVDCRDKMDPVAWWENFGFETPNLQALAIKLLSQISSVTMCEEISQADEISSQDAAKVLGLQRVEDLLYVRNNLRLHSQRNSNLCYPSDQASNILSSSPGMETLDDSLIDQPKTMVSVNG